MSKYNREIDWSGFLNILHIITQKPNSTGSGVYLTGLVEGFEKIGHKQAVIAGIDAKDERRPFSESVEFYPVVFNDGILSFPVVGMSDSMPYESTRYRDLTEKQVLNMKYEFKKRIDEAIYNIKPDIIICHHLYLLTAFVRSIIKDIKVVSICHGTCLRQYKSIDLEKEEIKCGIESLDAIFALHDEQKKEIEKTFNIDSEKVITVGSGYNDKIFYKKEIEVPNDKIYISYAGKICKSKGLISFIKSLDKLEFPEEMIEIYFAGIGSDKKTYNEIIQLANECKYKINFVGKLGQDELSDIFIKSQLFVLPSFYEGLPVVILEALACGNRVVTTDIAGVKDWIGENINGLGIIDYVKLPSMVGQGIPKEEDLPDFEHRLANTLSKKIADIINGDYSEVSVDKMTWDALAVKIDNIIHNNKVLKVIGKDNK